MSLRAEKLVYPGKCIAYDEQRRTVFIDGVLPGEEVEIQAWRKRKGIVEARAGRILTTAKERVTPRCPSFGVCGGCSFQHAGYEDQLRLKLGYTQEILDKVGVQLEGIVPSPEPWNYRNKVELSFGVVGAYCNTPLLGFHQKGRFDEYVRVPPCFIADEDFLPLIETIEAFARESGLEVFDPNTGRGFWRHVVLRKGKRTGDIMTILVTTPLSHEGTDFWSPLVQKLQSLKVSSVYWVVNTQTSDAVIPETVHHLSGGREIEERLEMHGRTFHFTLSPFSFFQTNTLGAEKLYETVLDFLNPQGSEAVLDLFCGMGSIGLCIAPLVRNVHGVEIVSEAIEQARKNAELHGVTNATFEAVAAEKWIKQQAAIGYPTFAKASAGKQQSASGAQEPGKTPLPPLKKGVGTYDAIIVDPPRGGMHPRVTAYLKESGAKTIIYVSCNPTTLARDLEVLLGEKNPPSCTTRFARVQDIPDRVGDRLSFKKEGEYCVERAIAVDMFPQTYHVECVVRLTKSV